MAEEYIISVVIEGSDKASAPLKNVQKQTEGLNTSLINTMVALEGMASGLNQLVGGANKMVGALERTEGKMFGVQIATKAQIETLRNYSATLEFLIGPMEMSIALLKLKTVWTQHAAGASTKAAGAEAVHAAAIKTTNKALMASPMGLLLVTIVAVVAALIIVERETGKVTGAFAYLNKEIRELLGLFKELADVLTVRPAVEFASSLGDAFSVQRLGGV